SWPRPSSSNTFALFTSNNVIYPREKVELIAVDNNSAQLTGYYYEVFDTLGNFIDWWPKNFSSPMDFKVEYSVLSEGDFAELYQNEINNSILVYPNPSNSI